MQNFFSCTKRRENNNIADKQRLFITFKLNKLISIIKTLNLEERIPFERGFNSISKFIVLRTILLN